MFELEYFALKHLAYMMHTIYYFISDGLWTILVSAILI